jgi:protein TonB
MMKHSTRPRHGFVAAALAALAAALTGCGSRVPLNEAPVARTPVPAPDDAARPAETAAVQRTSGATSAGAYRSDAASHVYALNQPRIFKGRLPPLLYAIGTLQVEVDRSGHVRKLNWMRAPKHAPEVVAEIERMVRAAEPFPAPVRLGRVTYTDTWLWDKSGRFQLHTLTEGQD